MKVEELQIGDWVKLCNKKGEWLDYSQVDLNLLNRQAEGIVVFKPIPLTPEILEKNGFSEDYRYGDLSYAQSCGDVIGIHINGKNGLMDEMYFKYVHELQHAMRLCGIEREIILN